jgi:CheY-like chemotaxis protein
MMSAASVTSFPRRPPPNILVVDDDVITRCHVCDELRARGLKVLEANSADDAMAILDRVRVDLLVIDVHLPGSRNGLEVARLVHNRSWITQIIMTSAAADGPHIPEPEALGMLIQKPYLVEQVVEIVLRRLNWPSAANT